MKQILKKIYDDTRLFYGLGFFSGLFLMFISFRDLGDFITRESVLSFSLFTTIMFAGLFIQEFSNRDNQSTGEEEQVSEAQEATEPALSFNDSHEEEKVVYEWEEEDVAEQKEGTIQTEEEPDTNNINENKEDPISAGFTPEKEDDPFG